MNISISCFFINIIFFNYLKYYIDEKNVFFSDLIKSFEIQTSSIQETLQTLDESSKQAIEKNANLEEKINSVETVITESKTMIEDKIKEVSSNEETINKKYEDLSGNMLVYLNDTIENKISENTSQQKRVSDFSLLRKIKNTKIINFQDGKPVNESIDSYTIKLKIPVSPSAGINQTEKLNFDIINLFYINGYVYDSSRGRISHILPQESFKIPSPNVLYISSQIIPNEGEELYIILNGTFNKYLF